MEEEGKVYCGCFRKGVDMGSVCTVFPRADFDLEVLKEKDEYARV